MKIIKDGLPEGEEIALYELEATYIQEKDCMDDNEEPYQELKIKIQDEGAGNFMVISTKRWAIENADDLSEIIKDFKQKI